MARNPYVREWVQWVGALATRVHVSQLVVRAHSVWYSHERDSGASGAGDWTGRAALRIRWGARQACRRLRAERDEARANYRFMVERAADERLDGYRELGEQTVKALEERDVARSERDTARRELRALEWLAMRGYPIGREPGGPRVSASPEPSGDPWCDTWHECAVSCGMRETDDD